MSEGTTQVLRIVTLLGVVWTAYKVTAGGASTACPKTTLTGDLNNCRWVDDPASSDPAKKLLECRLAGGTTLVDTTGVGSGGNN